MSIRTRKTAAEPIPITSRTPLPAADAVEIMADIEQGSPEWFRLHIGVPSASNFATIMASGIDGGDSKTRAKLMRRMAGEIITGEPAENYSNAYMDRGNAMESEARHHYAFTRNVELTQVGFVRRTTSRGRVVGCSPDSLFGDHGVLEIKTMMPELMIELFETGRFPTQHRAQTQGSLWVTGRDLCDLVIFYRGMPDMSFRVERDEVYIKKIAEAVEVFDYELRKMVEKLRSMGS